MTDLITLAEPRSAAAEAYRSLRTNLGFAGPAAPRRLLVAAAATEADKSGVLANLAVVTAQSGRRVVVADCDLRRPAQHRLFELPNAEGVASLLAAAPPGEGALGGQAPEDRLPLALPLQATGVPGLEVLTSGPPPPDPAERLGSRAFPALVERLSEWADLVLFDAPPLLAVTDAALVAPLVDGVILVLAAGRSRRDHAERARAILDQAGARLIGVVLTGVEPETVAYGGEAEGGP